jgi:hypothetical protein
MEIEVVSLRLKHDRTCVLMKRFSSLKKWQQELIREDMESAFENRIKVMERVNRHGI